LADELPLEDHFRNPRNAGVLDDADLQVRVENPVCGDVLQLYLRRGPDGRVAACRFQVYGCPAAIAAGSVLTELLQGAAPGEFRGLSAAEVGEALGGLPAEKYHACVLASDAVVAALAKW
jgi:NifU-like protein involved in Fe-S cluster formation